MYIYNRKNTGISNSAVGEVSVYMYMYMCMYIHIYKYMYEFIVRKIDEIITV
jgi:hypothetical protein